MADDYFRRLQLSNIVAGKPTLTLYQSKRTICFTPYLFSLVDAFGGVYVCCHLYDDNGLFTSEQRRKYIIGNLTTKRGSSLAGAGNRLLGTANIKNLDRLVTRLKDTCDPLSQYIQRHLSQKTWRLIQEYNASEHSFWVVSNKSTSQKSQAVLLQEALVSDLNRLLKGPCLFDKERFCGLTLTEEAQKLIIKNPQGEALVYLNRLLLEEAYPNEIAKAYKNFIDAWRSASYQNIRHRLMPIDVVSTPCGECTRHWFPNTLLTRLYEDIFLPMVETLGFDEAMHQYETLVSVFPEEDVWF